ncbi:MAG TPA: hypothetical protein DEV73_03870 [Candidatus Zambryskibacteria bacterium]|nr:hypothetical protein [Candidatus Zambryskibacteria bacterium]
MHAKINSYLIQIILLTLPFVLPQFHIHDDNSTLLTAISLLFAILVGFFIAATTSNYLRLQTLIADANAQLISICNLVKIIEPNKSEEIVQAIDDYMISSLDYELLDFTDNTKKEFSRVLEIANGIEPKDDRGFALVAEIQSRTYTILSNNQESTMTAKRIVTTRHWSIIALLAVLLAISLLSFRNGNIVTSLFVGVMFLTVYHIMTLVYEIDSNIFLSKQLEYNDPQQVFEGIGRMNYYPKSAIDKGDAKPKTDTYRIGIYKDYPNSLEKEIKIIEPSK